MSDSLEKWREIAHRGASKKVMRSALLDACEHIESVEGIKAQAIAEKLLGRLPPVGPCVVVSCGCGVTMSTPFDQHQWECVCGETFQAPNGAGIMLINQARKLAEAWRDECAGHNTVDQSHALGLSMKPGGWMFTWENADAT